MQMQPAPGTVVATQPQMQQPFQPQMQQLSQSQTQQLHNTLLVTGLEGHRDWSTSLFDCFSDMESCLCTFFLYPCAVGRISSRLKETPCTTSCVPGATLVLRNRIRTMGGIRGTICNDCWTLLCCAPCATCQELRELNNMGIR